MARRSRSATIRERRARIRQRRVPEELDIVVEQCMQLLSSHGIPVSLPSELPSAVEAALETLDERHEAIEVGLRLVDLSKESSVSKSDAEAMRACAEQICMLCLIAYEEALESGDLEERLEEARHLGVSV